MTMRANALGSRTGLAHLALGLRREGLVALRCVRPGAPVLLLWLGLILALGLVSAFAAVTDRFAADLWITRHIQATDLDGFSRAGLSATNLSSPNASAAALLAAVTVLLLFRRPRLALFAAASAWTHLLGGLLKVLVNRPRPPGDLIETVRFETEFSYPSGHVEWVVGFEGFLVFAVWQLTANRIFRAAAVGAWALHIALTSLGRVDQGLHWPSDVLGGALVGALTLSVTTWAYLAARRAAVIAKEGTGLDTNSAPVGSASRGLSTS